LALVLELSFEHGKIIGCVAISEKPKFAATPAALIR